MCLTRWLLDALTGLRHRNGRRVIEIHGPADSTTAAARWRSSCATATVASSTIDGSRSWPTGPNISLRTGCFCNPGAGEVAHGLGADEMAKWFGRDEPMSFRRPPRRALAGTRPRRCGHQDLGRRGDQLRRRLPVHVLPAGLRRPHRRRHRTPRVHALGMPKVPRPHLTDTDRTSASRGGHRGHPVQQARRAARRRRQGAARSPS